LVRSSVAFICSTIWRHIAGSLLVRQISSSVCAVLALLRDNLADPVYDRALDLLRALASLEYSAALHAAAPAARKAAGKP
jgi:hypothetical protein